MWGGTEWPHFVFEIVGLDDMVISNCCVIFVVFSVVVGGGGDGVVVVLRVVVTHTFLMFLLYLAIVCRSLYLPLETPIEASTNNQAVR